METEKIAAIQAVSTFIILLSSSILAGEIKYNDHPTLAPAESELGKPILCDRACSLALQGLENVSRSLSDLKAQPSENISMNLLYTISACRDGLHRAKSMIQRAVKEGPEQSLENYASINRFTAAIEWSGACSMDDPITREVTAAYKVAISLITNARESCS